MNWIINILKKYREVIAYLFFGVLTTAVNWIVYFPMHNAAHFSATLSTVIAWAVAVVFAFFTNKPFVYQSTDWSKSVVLPEFLKFVGCRVGSGVFESLFLLFTVDIWGLNGNWMKIAVSVGVVIINYIGGKLLFKKK